LGPGQPARGKVTPSRSADAPPAPSTPHI
jgi:hypothetical protein